MKWIITSFTIIILSWLHNLGWLQISEKDLLIYPLIPCNHLDMLSHFIYVLSTQYQGIPCIESVKDVKHPKEVMFLTCTYVLAHTTLLSVEPMPKVSIQFIIKDTHLNGTCFPSHTFMVNLHMISCELCGSINLLMFSFLGGKLILLLSCLYLNEGNAGDRMETPLFSIINKSTQTNEHKF